MTDPQKPSPKKLTARQRERNELVLIAALDILRERGYEKTFVQDVARASGVSLGTIYTHFRSKDYLIYRAAERWVSETTRAALPEEMSAPIEVRMARLVRESARALFAEPLLLEGWARANLSTDPDVVARVTESKLETSLQMYPIEAFPTPELAADIALLMENVWFTGIVRWSLGQKALADVPRDVEHAMNLVFQAHRNGLH